MSRSNRSVIASLFLAGLVMFAAQTNTARADLFLNNVTVTPEAGQFRWTYNLSVLSGQRVQSQTAANNPVPDFFTIYDFAGLVPATNMQPVGWTFSTALLGVTPTGVVAADDPSIPNLTWTFNGATPITGPSLLGDFSVRSTFDLQRRDDFTSETTINGGINNGMDTRQLIPDGAIVPTAVVPEPASLALWGLLGLTGAWYGRRKLAARQAA